MLLKTVWSFVLLIGCLSAHAMGNKSRSYAECNASPGYAITEGVLVIRETTATTELYREAGAKIIWAIHDKTNNTYMTSSTLWGTHRTQEESKAIFEQMKKEFYDRSNKILHTDNDTDTE